MHFLHRTARKLVLTIRGYSTESGSRVGFIGLGNMGNHMAANLLKKGHTVQVYDIQSAATAAMEKLGAKVAASAKEVAENSDRIITMLPASAHVKIAYTGPMGILQGAKPGSLFLDSSTIDPDTSKEMSVLCKEKGCTYLDCPVSGGVGAASAGSLTFMVGGPKKEFDIAESLLLCMGGRVVHCGIVGSGQVAKICNNMLLAITMIGTAETMNLGMRLGLEPKLLASIINSSSGRCWSSEVYNPVPGVVENVPSSKNYEGGFGTALMTKDLGLAQAAASNSASATPLGSIAYQIYQIMCSQGYKPKDFSSVYQFLKQPHEE